ncbi:SLC13 family permease [Aeromicrobium sp. CF4.19]|uniref:SLC13 family permease n=1 Tax=Aeromicrobium sp. CF4.19 TaxID=3373082 RepID=UPI003EE65F19
MLGDVLLLLRVVGFLVAILVLARACAAHGLFEAWAGVVTRSFPDSASRRLALATAACAVVAVALTVDSAVVLMAPILVAATAVSARRATAYAAVRSSNTGTMLLPVSNITNLLAFGATGLTFGRFAWLVLPVWVVGLALEWAVVRWWFRDELHDDPAVAAADAPAVPLHCTAVLIVVLLGIASGLEPWIPATAGALILTATAMRRRLLEVDDVIEAAQLPLAIVIMVWGTTVIAARDTAVGSWVPDLVPSGSGWFAVVGTALLAMVLAGLVNNIPATLLLLPGAAAGGPVIVLAMLVGLNVGSNLTAIGSLGNVLWWRTTGSTLTTWREFHRISLVTTPLVVVACASTLWAWTSLLA